MLRHCGTESDASIGRGPKTSDVEHRGFARQNHTSSTASGRVCSSQLGEGGIEGMDLHARRPELDGLASPLSSRVRRPSTIGLQIDCANC